MRIAKYLLGACVAVLGGASSAAASVEVIFVHPEHYTDASLHGSYRGRADEATLREIRTYLERLGDRYLTPDEHLTVEVLDIDLAGQYEPWRRYADDVRVLREVTWPRIKLRYSLAEHTTIAASAEETVSDLNYLANPAARYTGEQLPYEKAMLENWFRARFAEHRPPPA
jgi:hypothetical protein